MTACFKMMVSVPYAQSQFELPSDAPWQYNSVLGDVVGVMACGLEVNFDSGEAPHPCAS